MRNGFTLLELSIVLVIIGLVIGGVVAGRSLIEAAELQKSIGIMSKMNVAVQTFRLKYNALPGDMNQATLYNLHLNSAGVNNTCPKGGAFTFNGDGDSILGGYRNNEGPRLTGEIFNFNAHLNNAGLWTDTIVDKADLGAICQVSSYSAGTHYPSIPLGDGFLVITDTNTLRNYFVVGGLGAERASVRLDHVPIVARFNDDLTAAQAFEFDTKLDDGQPLSGHTKVCRTTTCYRNDTADTGAGYLTFDDEDSATNCVYNSEYNLGYGTPACTLMVELGKI